MTYTQLARYVLYKVGIISEVYGTIPLIIPLVVPLVFPLCLESPSPVPKPLLLTWSPSLGRGAIPVYSGTLVPGCLCTELPPPPSLPILFSCSPTVPHFKYVPSHNDITTSASHSPIHTCYSTWLGWFSLLGFAMELGPHVTYLSRLRVD
jgi:hypothetical protein